MRPLLIHCVRFGNSGSSRGGALDLEDETSSYGSVSAWDDVSSYGCVAAEDTNTSSSKVSVEI